MDKNKKKVPKGHTIKKQIINVRTNVGRKGAKAVQEGILDLYKRRIAPRMEQLFDKLVPADVHIYLDKLVLDLGEVKLSQLNELEAKILDKLEREVREALRAKGIRPLVDVQGVGGIEERVAVKRDLLLTFLEDGYYPSWADVSNGAAPELMEELLEEHPASVLALLEKVGDRAAVQRRLIYQFGSRTVEKILELLYGDSAGEVMKQLAFLQKRLMRQFPAASMRKVERLTQGAALAYILDKRGKVSRFRYDERELNRSIIERVQTEYQDFYMQAGEGERTRVREGYEGNYQDMDILRYFLENGSIPMWADVDSRATLQEIFGKLLGTRLVPLQRMVEAGIDNERFLQRLVYQFPTGQLLRLLEPVSGETVDFVEETIAALRVFAQGETGLSRRVSVQEVRERVLTVVLEYAFRRKRTNFVKQTIFQDVVEALAPSLGVSSAVVMEELYTAQTEKRAEFGGEVSAVISGMMQKRTSSQERQVAAREKIVAEMAQINVRLAEIERMLESGVGKEVVRALRAERQQLERQLTGLMRQESALTAKDLDAGAVYLEWQAIEVQREAQAQRQGAELPALTKAQEALVLKLEQRLEVLLRDLGDAYVQATSTERTLLLQRLHKELASIVAFFERRLTGVERDLEAAQVALQGAASSKERQRWRKLRERLQRTAEGHQQQLAETRAEAQRLATLIADLTRITMKEGEDIDSAGETTQQPTASGRSKLDYLIFFLEFGAIPWWAEEYKNISIEQIFTESLQKDSLSLRQAFGRLGRTPVLWQRLVNQLSEDALGALVERIYPRQAAFVLAQAEMLERIFTAKAFPKLKANSKEFKWSKIVELLLSQEQVSEPAFLQQLIKITALDFNVAPSELMGFMHNIALNIPKPVFQPIAELLQQANDNPDLREVEDELLRAARRQRLQEAGMMLSDIEKISIIQDFIASGVFNPEARRANIDTPAKIEELIAEQIDTNIAVLRATLADALRNPKRVEALVKNLSPASYWQIVQVLSSTSISVAQRYYSELAQALQDNQLVIERTMLLLYARENAQKVFDPKFFLQRLIEYIASETNRNTIAIANEWKRKLQPINPNSSLLIYVMAIELETLKAQDDPSDIIKAQIAELNAAYTIKAQQMYPALQQDSVEIKGVPEEPAPLESIQNAIRKIQEEIQALTQQLLTLNPQTAILQTINTKTKQAQLQAQLQILQLKIPAQIRLKAQQIQQIQTDIQTAQNQYQETLQLAQLNTQALQEQNIPLDTPPITHLDPQELPPPQRTAETLAHILFLSQNPEAILNPDQQEENPTQIISILQKELHSILQSNTQNNDQLDLLSLLDLHQDLLISPLAQPNQPLHPLLLTLQQQLPKNAQTPQQQEEEILNSAQNLQQKISSALHKHPHIQQTLTKINQAQSLIQRQLTKSDIPQLLQHWQSAQNLQDQLIQLIDKDKSLANNEALFDDLVQLDELQITLYRQIQRQQQRQLNNTLKSLQTDQRQLAKSIRNAASPQQIQALLFQIDQAENQQIQEIQSLTNNTKDKTFKNHFSSTQKNILKFFKRLRNQALWQQTQIYKHQAQQQALDIQQKQELQAQLQHDQQTLAKDLAVQQKEAIQEEKNQAQLSQAEQRKRNKLLPPGKPVDEPLFIKNAGLVILSPYLTRYLDILKLIENKMFVSVEAQYKAVHLLQYLVNKQIETPENELILNKIICGLPLSAPVPLTADISEPELKFSESLLQGAINNWARLKTMSPDAMRSTFLIRTGRIVEEADRWKLTVDKGSFDMLLRTITWGFTFVKYPWMEKAIFVEWDYM